MEVSYITFLTIFGVNGTPYRFALHTEIKEGNYQPSVLLICGIIKHPDNNITYDIQGIAYTDNLGDLSIKHGFIDQLDFNPIFVIAYYWDGAPKGMTLHEIKDDILQNQKQYQQIKEINFNPSAV